MATAILDIDAFKRKSQALLDEQRASPPTAETDDCLSGPLAFVTQGLTWADGQGPTDYQREVLRDFPRHRRVCLRSPHSAGKTALAAWIVLWFALSRERMDGDWKAVLTASAWRQLSHYLMPEIRKWAGRVDWAKIGRGPFDQRTELLALNLKLSRGEAFTAASDKPDLIEGAHADHLLYVFDEAKAIPGPTWDAAEGALASENSMALAISTPGEPHGRFYDIQSRVAGTEDWWVKHITAEQCIAAGRMALDWARDRARQWCGAQPLPAEGDYESTALEGILGLRIVQSSAVFANRVLGEFAASEADGIIPLAWVEAANRRWLALEDSGDWGDFTCAGVDVATSGTDMTVIAMRYGDAIRELRRSSKRDTMETAGAVAGVLQGHGGEAIVDVIGVGAGVVHRLKEQGKAVRAFNSSERSDAKDRSGELGFVNKRSAAWWHLRELLDPASETQIALPPDDLLTGDLTAPHWRDMSAGKIQVEAKDDIRKRLGRSTDDGDAVVMAFWKEPAVVYPKFRIARA